MEREQIGRYKLIKEIGRGGMAIVYLAHDPRFKRDVALKVLPRQFTHDPMFRTRFEREAQTIAALEHPAIVPVYDFGEEDSQPYLVMRYMPGGSLSDRLDDGRLTLMQVIKILDRVAAALDRAHSLGIIHRDLKPGNILFDQYDDAFLADFGIAKMAEATAALTGSAIVGTPAYMSPEQVKGQKVDGRADIYSLGIILFELLTGQKPFNSDTPMGLAFKHVHEPAPRITETKEDLPSGLDMTINRAMAKEPDERFSTAGDLAARVRETIQQTATVTADEAEMASGTATNAPEEAQEEVPSTEVLSEEEIAQFPTPDLKSKSVDMAGTPEAAFGIPERAEPLLPEKPAGRLQRFPWWWGVTAVIVVGLLIFAGARLLGESGSATPSDEPAETPEVAQQTVGSNDAVTYIREKWEQDFRVTDVGYGNGVWAAVMSQGSPYGRQTWQTNQEFPGEFIQTKWDEGFRVTNVTYGNGAWAVIMSQDSPYGRQTWQTKEAFPREFVQTKWDEGFRITSVTYGNGVWAVIMSQDSSYGRQTWQTAEAFPREFVQAKWDEGFRITSVTYGKGVWAVILSQDSPYGRQTWQTKENFPTEFIQVKWDEGFRISSLGYGKGVWLVVMSQDGPFGRQTWQTARRFVP